MNMFPTKKNLYSQNDFLSVSLQLVLKGFLQKNGEIVLIQSYPFRQHKMEVTAQGSYVHLPRWITRRERLVYILEAG